MGVQQSYYQDLRLLNQNEWQETTIDEQQEMARFGNFNTYRNIHTQQKIDAYEIDFQSRLTYKSFIQTFRWRKSQENIVRGKYINFYPQDSYCSQNFIGCAYIEHIRTRLSDITDIPFPENLYVAIAMIEGYKKLSQKFGCFQVKESQVCVDQEGSIRVWINESLQKNYPQTSIEAQNIREEDMVQQIIYIVSQNTDKEEQPQQCLFDFVYENQDQINFFTAKSLIYQYAKKYQVQIPNFFQSVLQIFRHNQEECQESQLDDKSENKAAIETNQCQLRAQVPENVNQHKQQNYQHNVNYPVSSSSYNSKPVNFTQPFYVKYPQHQNIYRNPLGYLPVYQNSSPHVIQYRFPKVNQNMNSTIYNNQPPNLFRSTQPQPFMPVKLTTNSQNAMINTNQIPVQNNSFLVKSPSKAVDFKQIAVGTSIISPFNTSEKEKNNLTQLHKYQAQQSQSQKNSKIFQQRQQEQYHKSSYNTEQHKFYNTSDKHLQIQQANGIQQMNNSSMNPIIIISNQPSIRMSNSNKMQNRLCYFTAQSQQQIDPEIAADLLKLYTIF